MRAEEKTNLIKVGIFSFFMTCVLMVFVILISSENRWFVPKTTIRAHLPNAQNLKVGGIVQLGGLKIGKIKNILIKRMHKIEIQMEIDSEYLQWIKRDSRVEIASKGLVGDKLIQIVKGSDVGVDFNPQKDVLKAIPSMTMDQMMNKGTDIAEKVNRVLGKFENLLDQATKDGNFYETMANTNKATQKLNTILTRIEQKKTFDKLDTTLSRTNNIMGRIDKGPGTMHSLIYSDELYLQLNKVIGGAGRSDLLKYFIRQSLDENQQNE